MSGKKLQKTNKSIEHSPNCLKGRHTLYKVISWQHWHGEVSQETTWKLDNKYSAKKKN